MSASKPLAIRSLLRGVARRFSNPRATLRFLRFVLRRYLADRCWQTAASLSYTTLLSLVPLLAIALAVLSAFPVFDAAQDQIQALILGNFLPDSSAEVMAKLSEFVENARHLTAPGAVALAVTALLLLANVNRALNGIWRCEETRSLPARILAYWTLLTLGPLLLGASLSVSGYAFALVQWSGIDAFASGILPFSGQVSIFLATLGFTMLFHVMPARAVPFGHALAGGVVAALIFDGLKFGFGFYLENFPTYEAVYGALSAIPIFLLWMYLSWAVVLFGAEVAAALPEWRDAPHFDRRHKAGDRIALAISLLVRFRAAQAKGDLLDSADLASDLPATAQDVRDLLGTLTGAGLVVEAKDNRWLLAKDLSRVTLGDLCAALAADLSMGADWPEAAERSVTGLQEALGQKLAVPLNELLAQTVPGTAGRLELIRRDPAADRSARDER